MCVSGEMFYIFRDVMLMSISLHRTVFRRAVHFRQSKVLFKEVNFMLDDTLGSIELVKEEIMQVNDADSSHLVFIACLNLEAADCLVSFSAEVTTTTETLPHFKQEIHAFNFCLLFDSELSTQYCSVNS